MFAAFGVATALLVTGSVVGADRTDTATCESQEPLDLRLAILRLKGLRAYDEGRFAEAVDWYRLAADQGDAGGQWLLGNMYEEGKGIPQSYIDAVRWYRRAAVQGYAVGQSKLGSMYEDGRGVPQDYTEAVIWYRLAADQGEVRGQWSLGRMFEQGRGVPQNYVEAYKWFALSAAQTKVAGVTMDRDKLLNRMTPAQIAEGQRIAAAWRPIKK